MSNNTNNSGNPAPLNPQVMSTWSFNQVDPDYFRRSGINVYHYLEATKFEFLTMRGTIGYEHVPAASIKVHVSLQPLPNMAFKTPSVRQLAVGIAKDVRQPQPISQTTIFIFNLQAMGPTWYNVVDSQLPAGLEVWIAHDFRTPVAAAASAIPPPGGFLLKPPRCDLANKTNRLFDAMKTQIQGTAQAQPCQNCAHSNVVCKKTSNRRCDWCTWKQKNCDP